VLAIEVIRRDGHHLQTSFATDFKRFSRNCGVTVATLWKLSCGEGFADHAVKRRTAETIVVYSPA
jgi:hypothetical protein